MGLRGYGSSKRQKGVGGRSGMGGVWRQMESDRIRWNQMESDGAEGDQL